MNTRHRLASLVAILAAFTLVSCERPVRAPYMRDADSRIVIYHGVNVSNFSKYSADFLPWQTKDDFARLNDWGFNVVRYLVFWEAIEPAEGTYDEEYLDATVERIGWLNDLGIDVIVDLHQDLYSGQYGGDGFPDWSMNTGGASFTPQEPWGLNYLQPAVMACFNNFWGSDDLKGKYVAMVKHLLEHVDGLPNVIGLDIMNEPYGADHFTFEPTTLSHFYKDVQNMHAANAFTTPLYFEPRITTSAGLKSALTFKPQAGCVYAPHYYELFTDYGMGYPDISRDWTERMLKMRISEARAFDRPLFLGEFGIHHTTDNDFRYLNDLLGLLDYYQIGWSYWSYDVASEGGYGLVDSNGDETPTLLAIVRMFPQRIAGDDPEWSLGEQSFDLTYAANASSAPTVIFIPEGLDSVHVWQNGTEIPYDNTSRLLSVNNAGGAGAQQTIHIEWQQPG